LAARRHSDIIIHIFVGSDENVHDWEYGIRFNLIIPRSLLRGQSPW
jgi:hypothetical protein